MPTPVLPGFFDQGPRPMAPASLESWDRILPTLSERETEVFYLVADYLAETRYADVTGGELAAWANQSILSIRPRLSGLTAKGWLSSGPLRVSRAAGEARCRPHYLAVPRAAVERVKPSAGVS